MKILEKLISYLVQPRIQRTQLLLSYFLSTLLLVAFSFQIQVEQSRSTFPPLDSANLSSCDLDSCPAISSLAGLEVAGYTIVEKKWATFVEVRFVNHGRLIGNREFWLELRDTQGQIAEAARTTLVLEPVGPSIATFSFQRTPELLRSGELRLGY